jgi:hypothetical protein
MAVFEQASLLDHCDLFISSEKKPGDAFECLEEELEPEDGEAAYGQQPESVKQTQSKPDHALQQFGGKHQNKA